MPSLTIVTGLVRGPSWIPTSNRRNHDGIKQPEASPRDDQLHGGARGIEAPLRRVGHAPQELRAAGRGGPGQGAGEGRQGRREEEGGGREVDGRAESQGAGDRPDHRYQRSEGQRQGGLELGRDRPPGQGQPRWHHRREVGRQGHRQQAQQAEDVSGPHGLEHQHPQDGLCAKPFRHRDTDAGRPIHIRVYGAVFETRCPTTSIASRSFWIFLSV